MFSAGQNRPIVTRHLPQANAPTESGLARRIEASIRFVRSWAKNGRLASNDDVEVSKNRLETWLRSKVTQSVRISRNDRDIKGPSAVRRGDTSWREQREENIRNTGARSAARNQDRNRRGEENGRSLESDLRALGRDRPPAVQELQGLDTSTLTKHGISFSPAIVSRHSLSNALGVDLSAPTWLPTELEDDYFTAWQKVLDEKLAVYSLNPLTVLGLVESEKSYGNFRSPEQLQQWFKLEAAPILQHFAAKAAEYRARECFMSSGERDLLRHAFGDLQFHVPTKWREALQSADDEPYIGINIEDGSHLSHAEWLFQKAQEAAIKTVGADEQLNAIKMSAGNGSSPVPPPGLRENDDDLPITTMTEEDVANGHFFGAHRLALVAEIGRTTELRGQGYILQATRRNGKSAFIAALTHDLNINHPATHHFVSRVNGGQTTSEVYWHLIESAAETMPGAFAASATVDDTAIESFFWDQLAKDAQSHPVVIMLDEAMYIVNNAPSFFRKWRAAVDSGKKISLVFVAFHEHFYLDEAESTGPDRMSSASFNIAQSQALGLFNNQDIANVLNDRFFSEQRDHLTFAPNFIKFIAAISQRNPYLIDQFVMCMKKQWREGKGVDYHVMIDPNLSVADYAAMGIDPYHNMSDHYGRIYEKYKYAFTFRGDQSLFDAFAGELFNYVYDNRTPRVSRRAVARMLASSELKALHPESDRDRFDSYFLKHLEDVGILQSAGNDYVVALPFLVYFSQKIEQQREMSFAEFAQEFGAPLLGESDSPNMKETDVALVFSPSGEIAWERPEIRINRRAGAEGKVATFLPYDWATVWYLSQDLP